MAEGLDTSEGVSSGTGQSNASENIGKDESEEDIHARHKREMKELKGNLLITDLIIILLAFIIQSCFLETLTIW